MMPSRPHWLVGGRRNGQGPVRCATARRRSPYSRGPSYAGRMFALVPAVFPRGRLQRWQSGTMMQQQRRSECTQEQNSFSSTESLAFRSNLLKLLVDLRSTVRISVSEAAVDLERPRENRRSSQWCEMIDPGFADSTLNSVTHGKKRAVLGAVGNSAGYLSLIGGGNSQRLHLR